MFECLIDKAEKETRATMLRDRFSIDVCALTTKLKVAVLKNIIIHKDKHGRHCCYSHTLSSLEHFSKSYSYIVSKQYFYSIFDNVIVKKRTFNSYLVSLETKTS